MFFFCQLFPPKKGAQSFETLRLYDDAGTAVSPEKGFFPHLRILRFAAWAMAAMHDPQMKAARTIHLERTASARNGEMYVWVIHAKSSWDEELSRTKTTGHMLSNVTLSLDQRSNKQKRSRCK